MYVSSDGTSKPAQKCSLTRALLLAYTEWGHRFRVRPILELLAPLESLKNDCTFKKYQNFMSRRISLIRVYHIFLSAQFDVIQLMTNVEVDMECY